MSPVRLHSSNPNLCAELGDFQPPMSSRLTDSVEYASDYIKLQEEFCTIAQKGSNRRRVIRVPEPWIYSGAEVIWLCTVVYK